MTAATLPDTHAAGSDDALRPRAPGGMGRGALLSIGVHGLLLLALAVSLVWRSQTPAVFEAELWAAAPQVAAPRPVEPTPAPVPVQKAAPPAPTPAPAPEPRPAPAVPDAQIAIEKARKAALEEAEKERLERARIDKAEKLKAEREKLEREKAERDKLQREAKAKEEARQREQKLAQEQKEQRDKQAREKAEEARLAKLREDNLKRMMGQAGATGAPSSTGTAAQDAAPSASYAGKLVARIRPNILMTDTVVGKPAADVEVRAAPSGTILSRRLVKSSGNKDWDDAVLRAIDRTGELPRDVDGRVPPVLVITFTPQ